MWARTRLVGDAQRRHAAALDWRRLGRSVDLAAWRKPRRRDGFEREPTGPLVPEFHGNPCADGSSTRREAGCHARSCTRPCARRSWLVRLEPTRPQRSICSRRISFACSRSCEWRHVSACRSVISSRSPCCTTTRARRSRITSTSSIRNLPTYAEEIAQRGQRVVTFLVYLNDDYGGGETAFPRLGISHKGRRGEGLFFVNALARRRRRRAHLPCGQNACERREMDHFAVRARPRRFLTTKT